MDATQNKVIMGCIIVSSGRCRRKRRMPSQQTRHLLFCSSWSRGRLPQWRLLWCLTRGYPWRFLTAFHLAVFLWMPIKNYPDLQPVLSESKVFGLKLACLGWQSLTCSASPSLYNSIIISLVFLRALQELPGDPTHSFISLFPVLHITPH